MANTADKTTFKTTVLKTLKELKEDLEEVRKMYEQKWKHQS